MKSFKILKSISMVCSAIGFIISLFGLKFSLQGIGGDGWERLGIIFLIPSVFAFIIILLDFLITVGKIKRGLLYSCISSFIKTGIIILLIPDAIDDYNYEMQYGASNLDFDLLLIISLFIIAIPSFFNIMKYRKRS